MSVRVQREDFDVGAEIAAGVYWLGHRFERFDLSAEALK